MLRGWFELEWERGCRVNSCANRIEKVLSVREALGGSACKRELLPEYEKGIQMYRNEIYPRNVANPSSQRIFCALCELSGCHFNPYGS